MKRLKEELAPLGVHINRDKTRIVNNLKGESFTFLEFAQPFLSLGNGDDALVVFVVADAWA